ncbi:bifunctional 4-hydroxy-2-oxoglutarate aldolase/2-dehydro-3-deoxy-phosphogluconate aldolase [Spirulina sp. CCNP1310]|uniref:bifunctional 4-hydroxy-2-oxoglutarate aldolase/2-dehydro-3-deoxy-phosphogluconate aldolase n=1 Tax=Spirulina sp. CCNP1310 TaxID=3110249 RepID=UPI002B204C89|nr:bifunctional 4-hydroxy-2-oxoglutarate aldolase/2-dehydro-3-deoxy-phosphogluconate aldolase [Spirulina sp. CCNP1310]MEA5420313.1 bifunctional 4-hydroxy-2-oxoglutarate aldolase/2-dehydro-3-deoxy-phosphogluconate aldolase [Spirulina sp. CCNP1310]
MEIFAMDQDQDWAKAWRDRLQQARAIAVIRAPTLVVGYAMAEAVIAGGMEWVEITWNSDRAADLITQLRRDFPHCCIGTGTILDPAAVAIAHTAGAQFLFSPHTHREIITIAQDLQLPVVAGALTPTEIIQAWHWGATAVKVFPVQAVGGAAYLRGIRGPLPQIPLIPTGGVTLGNVTDFLDAGAIAVGLAGQLFPQEAIAAGNWGLITERARELRSRLLM